MTFKHIDFDDSPIMRSLTRVASAKGWLPNEPAITKQAAATPVPDLQPSHDLTTNLLKLCSGLRTAGFDKQAQEIETKMLSYKKASVDLYNVSGETGDDLLGTAHPKGSHKLLDVDSKEATFEDLLDKHVQILKVVEKKPTGKLSNASEILNAVKTVLSSVKTVSAASDLDNLYAQALAAFQKFREVYGGINSQIGDDSNDNAVFLNTIQYDLEHRKVYDVEDLEKMLSEALSNFESDEKPGFLASSEDRSRWNDVVLPMITIAKRYAEQFRNVVSKIRELEAQAKTQSTVKQYDPEATQEKPAAEQTLPAMKVDFHGPLTASFQQAQNLKSKIQAWLAIHSISSNPALVKWIKDETSALDSILQNYGKVSEQQEENMVGPMQSEVAQEAKDIDIFETNFIKPKAQ